MTKQDKIGRLADIFTAQGLLDELCNKQIDSLYETIAARMEWHKEACDCDEC